MSERDAVAAVPCDKLDYGWCAMQNDPSAGYAGYAV